jgi:hypothetical protein
MSKIIYALLVAFSSATLVASSSAWGADAKPLELAPDAPERHTVVAGDTLWGIAAKFVKDPYRWPDLWRLNSEQIKNPHRIYPGQVVVLDRSGGDPLLRLETVRVQPKQIVTQLTQEIPAIPQRVIEPFLARPLIVEADALDSAPRIIALEDKRLMVGSGAKVYVTGLTDPTGLNYQLYRPGKPLNDPVTKEVLGHEAAYVGTAKVLVKGEPAIMEVTGAVAEVSVGDRLVPMPKIDIPSYVPHAPKEAIEGRVISVFGALGGGGRHSVVSLTRGTKDGIEKGHVLALYLAGVEATETFQDRKRTHTLPNERYGLVFVFRTFERISYALVMEAKGEVAPGHAVRTP